MLEVQERRKLDTWMKIQDPSYIKIQCVFASTDKILGIKKVYVDPSPTRYLISWAMHLDKVILMIGNTIQGIVITSVKNMDMFQRIA